MKDETRILAAKFPVSVDRREARWVLMAPGFRGTVQWSYSRGTLPNTRPTVFEVDLKLAYQRHRTPSVWRIQFRASTHAIDCWNLWSTDGVKLSHCRFFVNWTNIRHPALSLSLCLFSLSLSIYLSIYLSLQLCALVSYIAAYFVGNFIDTTTSPPRYTSIENALRVISTCCQWKYLNVVISPAQYAQDTIKPFPFVDKLILMTIIETDNEQPLTDVCRCFGIAPIGIGRRKRWLFSRN